MSTKTANVSRRIFIEGVGAFAATTLFGAPSGKKNLVSFGLVTDCHYADLPLAVRPMPVGDAAYRDSLAKMREFVSVMNRLRPAFAIELGDFKDQGPDKAATLGFLDKIEGVFAQFAGARYHVLGNHDMDRLTKDDFLSHVTNAGQPKALANYSFVKNGVTFIVLDACYNAKMESYTPGNWQWDDANVPPAELAWLEKELAAAKGPVVVFCHQRIDPAAEKRHLVKNAEAVRKVLEASRKVKGVFTGHQHAGGFCQEKGISYYSLRALVLNPGPEENSYAVATVDVDGGIFVTGYRKAETIHWG